MTTAQRIAAATCTPEQAQQVFRAILAAFARPGQIATLPTTDLPPTLLAVTALADSGTALCVVGDDSALWSDALSVGTDAPAVGLAAARLVAALRPLTADEVGVLARGTAEAPEHGAFVAIPVESVENGVPLRLSGPGVDGEVVFAPSGLDAEVVAARAAAVLGYPAGIDLLCVAADGRIVGLPRTTVVSAARIESDGRGNPARTQEN
ncbi:phosphonate C-P lyase system protein PhnH [Nocardia mangyaensis]|uniref:phosphonate C-P lyase system protein PhnH n=1 Tax=Nocardia mangyaensis TaxID=2213200 RepID=UPI002676E79B|nr:phosphonate C-P lyase system protein PhnH [Nocardia mangyaensis]MDO3649848.1 phosphonate C-P lyase system protein PhnH [Nocardia mangyaensis]